jgi:isopenicillin N synthase-like dioxygenase
MSMSVPARFHRSRDPFDHLPVIDISALYAEDSERRGNAAKALGQAARESGFCYVTGHRVPPELISCLLQRTISFFALPLEQKMNWYIGHSRNHRGYVPEGEEVFAAGTRDRKEAFDLGLDLPPDAAEVLAGNPMLGSNVWPDLDGFRETVQAYYESVLQLGRTLFRGFALALGLEEDRFVRFVNRPPSQLRLIHYPHNPDAEDSVGIGAHTDYECFTILLPTAPGLEVMNGAGVWVDVPPVPESFVVNIGDMFETWTNGEFVATSHRVRRVREERYSFPFFCVCDYDTFVEPLPQFVGPDRPPRYPPLKAGSHLFAQTVQSFCYLKQRLAAGELTLPSCALPLSSFGQEARHKSAEGTGQP